jgi:hypothetical protein
VVAVEAASSTPLRLPAEPECQPERERDAASAAAVKRGDTDDGGATDDPRQAVSSASATSQLTLRDEAVAVGGDEFERLRLTANCAGVTVLVEGELGEALRRERHRHA